MFPYRPMDIRFTEMLAVRTFAIERKFRLIDIGQRGLKWRTVVGEIGIAHESRHIPATHGSSAMAFVQ
jgi:hypothetical protein